MAAWAAYNNQDYANMDDRTKREQEVARGAQAEALLRNPLLQEAFEALEKAYIQEWINSTTADTVGREQVYFAQKALQKLKRDFDSMIETGRLASRQIEVMDEKEPFH